MTRQSEGRGGGQVSDEELAEIARQLRNVVGDGHRSPPPPRPAAPRRRVTPAMVVMRFVGAFVAPGLVLIAIILLGGLNG